MRLSGADAAGIAKRIVQFSSSSDLQPWRAHLGVLHDADGRTVDRVVATYYAAPRSYTAEDVVEIACHGAPVVLRHCLSEALRHGARLADPGEFTCAPMPTGASICRRQRPCAI